MKLFNFANFTMVGLYTYTNLRVLLALFRSMTMPHYIK